MELHAGYEEAMLPVQRQLNIKKEAEHQEVLKKKSEMHVIIEGVIAGLLSQQEEVHRDGIMKTEASEYLLAVGEARTQWLNQQLVALRKESELSEQRTAQMINNTHAIGAVAEDTKQKAMKAVQAADVIKNEILGLEAEMADYRQKTTSSHTNAAAAAESVLQTERDLNLHEDERRKLHNKIEELKGNIRVFCRIRGNAGDREIADFGIASNRSINIRGKERTALSDEKKVSEGYSFKYDHVFGMDSTQEEIFTEVAPLVQSCLDGFKVCIFAYGQTGSGKTFTMEGQNNNKGVIPRAVNMIFDKVSRLTNERGFTCSLSCSFLEIYNDQVKDLLGKRTGGVAETLRLMMGSNDEVKVEGLTEYEVDNQATVGELLATAQSNRACAATKMNDVSSRSHSIFMLRVKVHNPVTNTTCNGLLNLIDLAGSEKVNSSEVQGQRFKEAVAINSSLTHLGDVIHSLGTAGHVPFRNCTLTRLLKNSLGGSSKCLMMVNISPMKDHVEESIKSLRFAQRVNSTKVGVAKRSME
eukprot:TRINITY_DN19451_c1_g1_i1.p1 TRINITY_DN19451_c1_g1~~TRINITY_DN19451_c1_g1_i1.p1  ORF type:complete len:595 (+),score=138.35 TRINITY_DN19451_c1_g1_i1:206-1786(+)